MEQCCANRKSIHLSAPRWLQCSSDIITYLNVGLVFFVRHTLHSKQDLGAACGVGQSPHAHLLRHSEEYAPAQQFALSR